MAWRNWVIIISAWMLSDGTKPWPERILQIITELLCHSPEGIILDMHLKITNSVLQPSIILGCIFRNDGKGSTPEILQTFMRFDLHVQQVEI